MMKYILFCLLAALNTGCVFGQEPLLINAYHRASHSLNDKWHYIVDPYENGFYTYRYEAFEDLENPRKEAYYMNAKPADRTDRVEYDFDQSDTLHVPGDWNSQKERLFYYEGTIWYKTSFDYTRAKDNNRVFLYFGAVNYRTHVYLNGKKVGEHVGGFTPFNFEVTNLLKDKGNFLIVKVDNKREKHGVPTLNMDWWNYGGITRDVVLIEVPDRFIQDYFIRLHPEDKQKLTGYVKLSGNQVEQQKVGITIPELAVDEEIETNRDGVARLNINVVDIKYWSPENPYLYTVTFKTADKTITDHIGFRTIGTEGNDILLNGEKVFLRGICIHEENPLRGGRAYSLDDAKLLLGWAKELGCNYVRLVHYPHNEHIIRMADKLGIMVWEEIPVYWTISWDNEATYQNAEQQLIEVISRDKNRAAVIIWSMANETPTSDARNVFLTKLATQTRSLDPTRLISAALEQSDYQGNPSIRTIQDPFADRVDVLSFNQYIGWYDGLPDKCKNITWKIDQDKPILISEFGAGAQYGFHGDKLTRWSEEYQAYLYEETLNMVSHIEQLRGLSPWILADFRSPRRPLPNIQDGWNRKGLISDTGHKKKAFFVLKKFYEQKSRN